MNRKYIVICSFFAAFFVLSLLCYGSFEYAKKQEQKKLAQQNAAQTSTKQEQRVTSETKLVIEKWEEESEELVKEERDVPPEYAGLTREELEKQLAVEIKNKSWEEEKEGLVKITLESFSEDKIVIRKVYNKSSELFNGAWWVAPSAYFVGIAAIICSGIILKKTKMFAGEPAPFVMELPAYHMPTVSNVLRSMWERAWSFIKKAGTIILLSTIILWFLMNFGWVDGNFGMLEAEQLNDSILAAIGNVIAPIFTPLGWGDWKMAIEK